MILYENLDGGAIRLKPQGISNARYMHMREPHGCKCVKKDPASEMELGNEAFKVDGHQAIPSLPEQIELPEGIQPNTPLAENYIRDHWQNPSHVRIRGE